MIVERLAVDVVRNDAEPDRTRSAIFNRLLGHVVPFKPGDRLLDLGAGHCLFSKKARDLGFEVTAVDARNMRTPEDLGAIRFIQDDIRHFDPSGFDVVLNLGLFNHLAVPDQLSILRRCNRTPYTILETQVHDPNRLGPDFGTRQFSRLTVSNGYVGVEFTEVDSPMSAVGNPTSFWHIEASMLDIFRETGYASATVIAPEFMSKFGIRRYYVLQGAA